MEENMVGSYRELVGPGRLDLPTTDDPVVPVYIPPLVTMLWNLEKRQGDPLSEAQVVAMRDEAVCMTMRRSIAQRMAESRGYDDIDPEDVWHQWQVARRELVGDSDAAG
jgi:hypothetical protein